MEAPKVPLWPIVLFFLLLAAAVFGAGIAVGSIAAFNDGFDAGAKAVHHGECVVTELPDGTEVVTAAKVGGVGQ